MELKEQLIALYNRNSQTIVEGESDKVKALRSQAYAAFSQRGITFDNREAWKNFHFFDNLTTTYTLSEHQAISIFPALMDFECEVPDLKAARFPFLNGWYADNTQRLTTLDNGVILGSLIAAKRECPELIEQCLGTLSNNEYDGLTIANTLLHQDGMFVYVPDNVEVERPLQILNLIKTNSNLVINPRNLIVLGENARLTVLHCDDTLQHSNTLINAVTEVFQGKGSAFDYYKMENKEPESILISSLFVKQEQGSVLNTNSITFNAGKTRNNLNIQLNGKHCEADINGLYLVDRKQNIDNYVYVNHAAPDCHSRQLYKGIIDDEARAVFSGQINVAQDSQRTEAYQVNRNIALTNSARVITKPFLEIYADDVKCSHGATVGQLDKEAMFYLRTRGIGEKSAKMLLMHAFAAEVTSKIKIESLRNRVSEMAQLRLNGELHACEDCRLCCNSSNMAKCPSCN